MFVCLINQRGWMFNSIGRLLGKGSAKQPATADDPGNSPYFGLRDTALAQSRDSLGLDQSSPPIFGVVTDLSIGRGHATVVAFASADASLYFTPHGGVIGGGFHEPVRRAALGAIEAANAAMAAFSEGDHAVLPAEGTVRISALTQAGPITALVNEADLVEGRHALSPVFFAINDTLTSLRETVSS